MPDLARAPVNPQRRPPPRTARRSAGMPGSDQRSAIGRLSARLDRASEANAERVDKLVLRIESLFERLEAKLDLKVDQLDRDTQREIGEARRDLGELRDIVNRQGERLDTVEKGRTAQTGAAAEGAARGAIQATAAARPRPFFSTWKGWVTAAGAAIAGFAAAVQGLPPIVRFLDAVLRAIGGIK